MFHDLTSWIIAYMVGAAMLAGTSIIFWVGLKSFLLFKNLRKLSFGTGLLLIGASYFIMAIYNSTTLPPYITVPLIIGFNLVALSLIKTKTERSILLLNVLPLFISIESRLAPLLAAAPLLLAWLTARNYCFIRCGEESCHKNKIKNNEITLLFLLMTLDVALGLFIKAGDYQYNNMIANYILIALQAVMTIIIFYHILRCTHYSAREKIFIPLMVGFILLFTVVAFYSNQQIKSFNENQLTELSLRETKAAVILADKYAEPGLIADMVESKDTALNDIADRILLETGFRTTFFKDNIRIGASLSSTGGGRFLGSKLDDPVIRSRVLEEGGEAATKITKINQDLIASYVPVKKNGRTIGMIGTGILLTNFYKEQQVVLFKIGALSFIVFMIAFVAMAYDLLRHSKKPLL